MPFNMAKPMRILTTLGRRSRQGIQCRTIVMWWLMSICITKAYASFPYNPTYLFKPLNSNGGIIYLLEPPSSAFTSGRLLSFNTNQVLTSDNLSTTELSDALPFITDGSDGPSVSYVAVLDSDSSILIYSGNCLNSANEALIWKFSLESPSLANKGSWSQTQVKSQMLGGSNALMGPNYLASAFSYSHTSETENDDIYIFGGICPTQELISGGSMSSGNYSDQMSILVLESSNEYGISTDPVGGNPIAEAGSTLTPLTPSYTNTSDGTQAVEQDFVLIGGNTQTAFINMTQLAVFSLPQAQWNFVSVDVTTMQADATEGPAILEPRSGHSASLTADGSQIVIVGGWVGNTSTAAEPQLAVLSLGVGYGGSGDWSWYIPVQLDSPFTAGQGIYGHGATLLAENILMVTGGYTTAVSGASLKRDDDASNVQSFFFNITSGTWISSYDGSIAHASPSEPNLSGHKLSSSQKAGLGGGLAFGLLALLAAIAIGLFYWRKSRRRRQCYDGHPEKEIEGLSEAAKQGASSFGPPWSTGQGWDDIVQTRNAFSENGLGMMGAHNAERTGLDLEIPSPNRGLRRSMRPNYFMAPRFDDGRKLRFPNHMHAIEERSEEGSSTTSSRQVSGSRAYPPKGFAAIPASDPFQDPEDQDIFVNVQSIGDIKTDYVNNDLPSPAEERQKEMTEWIKDWAAVDAIRKGRSSPNEAGRMSPEKSDRASSSLSEVSNYSTTSGGIGPYRGPSTRAERYYGQPSTIRDFPSSETVHDPYQGAARPGTASADADSFTTAKSAASSRKIENLGLLKGEIPLDEEPFFTRRAGSLANRYRSIGVMEGLVGSVKRAIPRAISVATGSNMNRSISLTSAIPRPTVIGGDGYYDRSPTKENTRSAASSPAKRGIPKYSQGMRENDTVNHRQTPSVKRSVSDGAARFWESKRGANDWNFRDKDVAADLDAENLSHSRPFSMQTDHVYDGAARSFSTRDGSRSRQSDLSEDWDVEAAVEERVVQVMFTVPREKLRVVNADPKRDAMSDAASDEE